MPGAAVSIYTELCGSVFEVNEAGPDMENVLEPIEPVDILYV